MVSAITWQPHGVKGARFRGTVLIKDPRKDFRDQSNLLLQRE